MGTKGEGGAEAAPKARVAAAWAVHAFTASGVVTALLAIAALIAGDLRLALLWLGAALIIDGLDGPMARKVDVSRYAPRFDGAVLDLVIDYLTYTVIPALLIYRFGLVPAGLEIPAAAFIMLTSLYCFGNREMKTGDLYFSGFPAVWNVVVLYIYVLETGPWANLAAIAVLGVLTFVPFKYIHPFRVRMWRPLTLTITALWALSTFWLVLASGPGRPPLEAAPLAFWAFLAASLYFLGLCVWRTWRGEETAGTR
ncbi:CDP-alcohol phosphatidyltransferase family protein [Parvibaculum sp.]|uniref:CDP-alcohol phosphatidyltransferase family protein n=1 Tax=Parvibaculum sp. TaxID=2024848 RepID=UPI003918FE4D